MDLLFDPALDLRAGPVETPLELRIPSLGLSAAVLAVGIGPTNVMDVPMGAANDPAWQQAFWYRGGAVPGNLGTATIGGHVSGIGGRPALFARLGELVPGDLIIVHNAQSAMDVNFMVTEVAVYPLSRASDVATMARIYGPGPVSGTGPQESEDGLAHLTLITCSGRYVGGTFDHRLVIYAQRIPRAPAAIDANGVPTEQTWLWK
jgi:sortase (surface protein transpeptidase)